MSTDAVTTDNSPVVTLPLTPLDQIMPRLYTRLLLSFRVPPSSTHDSIIEVLRYGLKELITDIPYLTSKVSFRADGEASGRVEIRRQLYDRLELQVKDLTLPNSGWSSGTYDELLAQHIPPSLLDGDILAPVALFPDLKTPTGVIAAQANFIPGGLLLCVAVHHSVMDGMGMATVLKTWANWCRRGPDSGYTYGSEPEFPAAALDRSSLMEGSEEVQAHGHREYRLVSQGDPPAMPPAPPKVDSRIFYFSAASLSTLKAEVTNSLPPSNEGDPKPWISTTDALSALLWSCITHARVQRLKVSVMEEPDTEIVLGMAVDGRSRLDPPLLPEYIGNVTLYGTATAPLSSLTLSTVPALAPLALSVRSSVSRIDDTHIRSTITFLSSPPDIRTVKSGFRSTLGKDVAMTSWTELGIMKTDWGDVVGGRPTRVRVPMYAWDGLCVVFPRLEDGGLEVAIGLVKEDMESLRGDELFKAFSEERCA